MTSGIKAVGDSVKLESGKDFMLDPKYGYIHACPTNLGTGMRASVHVDLPGYTKDGVDKLKARCEELHLQPRGKFLFTRAKRQVLNDLQCISVLSC